MFLPMAPFCLPQIQQQVVDEQFFLAKIHQAGGDLLPLGVPRPQWAFPYMYVYVFVCA